MDDRKITALRQEIARRAPRLKIVQIGLLFGKNEPDAIVEDARGQYLWSVWNRYCNPPPRNPELPVSLAMPGQKSLF